ncbi:hypothetical protein SAMN05216317_1109 [Nitrosomonas eutropha]|uniref:hypothetical protein n=1 Tax=Nitrosomonas TaxID=914 RepID=UPI00089B2530|nr:MULTISPECIES: hypothetical protein [Nitrosomonas]MXS80852.1 hypothetical protein [Nitrosomonas sp. GH22]SDW67392.1 hypothetical protein SAMN05216317_1109 [Nitrosomonas eutropha]
MLKLIRDKGPKETINTLIVAEKARINHQDIEELLLKYQRSYPEDATRSITEVTNPTQEKHEGLRVFVIQTRIALMLANSYGLEAYQTLKTFMERQGYKTQPDSMSVVTEQKD